MDRLRPSGCGCQADALCRLCQKAGFTCPKPYEEETLLSETADEVDLGIVNPNMCSCRLAAMINKPPPAGGWPAGWKDWDVTKKVHHAAATEFLNKLPPYPEGAYSGRGIVIAGGGKYLPSTYVTCKMIREVGCKLPIQVWYLGAAEADPRYEELLKDDGVVFIDATTHPARASRRIVNGFEIKLFAVVNSLFEEVLFLDADCYPCVDPTFLFDEPAYRHVGGVYWPDLNETNAWTRWDFWGIAARGPQCGFETGQYLLNKRTAWRQMKLAEWYDDHSDWSYGIVGRTGGDYGDKGPHRAAWAKTKVAPVIYQEQATWHWPAFIQRGPDGAPVFIHRCRSKFVLDPTGFYTPQSAPNARTGLPRDAEAFDFLERLKKSLA